MNDFLDNRLIITDVRTIRCSTLPIFFFHSRNCFYGKRKRLLNRYDDKRIS